MKLNTFVSYVMFFFFFLKPTLAGLCWVEMNEDIYFEAVTVLKLL